MHTRLRKFGWDCLFFLAMCGIIYGAWEMIEAKGWGIGLPIAVLTVILGMLCVEILGPMWFGKRW